MSDALDTMTGVIPLVVVAGVTMKMTDNLFGQQKRRTVSRKAKKKNSNYVRKARRVLGT